MAAAAQSIAVQSQGQIVVYASEAGYVVIVYIDPYTGDDVKVLVRADCAQALVKAITKSAREILNG